MLRVNLSTLLLVPNVRYLIGCFGDQSLIPPPFNLHFPHYRYAREVGWSSAELFEQKTFPLGNMTDKIDFFAGVLYKQIVLQNSIEIFV